MNIKKRQKDKIVRFPLKYTLILLIENMQVRHFELYISLEFLYHENAILGEGLKISNCG